MLRMGRGRVLVIPRPPVRPRLHLGAIVDEAAKEEPPQEEVGHLDLDHDALMREHGMKDAVGTLRRFVSCRRVSS